jgi:hypothetical protein
MAGDLHNLPAIGEVNGRLCRKVAFSRENSKTVSWKINGLRASTLRIDTMLVRWFPKPAAVDKLLFHKPKRFTMEEKAYDNRSDPP